jgi:hypothetical protein
MKFILALAVLPAALGAGSPKRGLVYIPNSTTLEDDAIWVQPTAQLTWYYTYNERPNPDYGKLEFVPMMWGMGSDPQDKRFHDSVVRLIEDGQDIRHALAFNEPDLPNDWGGSNIEPSRAAQGYVANFVPLRQLGVKIGMPAVSGAGWGITWLREFVNNCTEILQGTQCPYDFVPVHWYDNFGGLVAHVEEAIAEYVHPVRVDERLTRS